MHAAIGVQELDARHGLGHDAGENVEIGERPPIKDPVHLQLGCEADRECHQDHDGEVHARRDGQSHNEREHDGTDQHDDRTDASVRGPPKGPTSIDAIDHADGVFHQILVLGAQAVQADRECRTDMTQNQHGFHP